MSRLMLEFLGLLEAEIYIECYINFVLTFNALPARSHKGYLLVFMVLHWNRILVWMQATATTL